MFFYAPILLTIVALASTPASPGGLFNNSPEGGSPEYIRILESDASCTDRCHVASSLYKSKFEEEIFEHTTHSPLQKLGCDYCHDKSDVKDEKHGKLLIDRNDCLTCHHVDYKEESCDMCHDDIDSNPMKFKDEQFLHGFDINSGVDCKMCHLPNPKSTMKEEINCDNCHHTTPDITCAKCHEEELEEFFAGSPAQMAELGWTDQFVHSQHPEDKLNCLECHPPDPSDTTGVRQYDISCTGCHHKDPKDTKESCEDCHKDYADFFRGKVDYKGVIPVPDKMSRILKCEDCHKLEGNTFTDVRDRCAECHNPQYAELLDAQRRVINGGRRRVTERLLQAGNPNLMHMFKKYPDLYNKTFSGIEMLQLYGVHNFSYSTRILSLLDGIIEGIEHGQD